MSTDPILPLSSPPAAVTPRPRVRLHPISPYVPAWGLSELGVLLGHCLSGRVVRGDSSRQLEQMVKEDLGIAGVLSVNRARSAIELALRALDVGPADEVVLPSYVCRAVLEPVYRVGAQPVFADVGVDLHLTPETVERAISPRTRCVIVPHLFGCVAPIEEIESMLQDSKISLIDDAAQSYGAQCGGRRVGTFGEFGIVSCSPGKSIVGPAGGLLLCKDPELLSRVSIESLDTEGATAVLRRVLAFWTWFRLRGFTLPFKGVSDQLLSGQKPYRCAAMSNLEAAYALRQYGLLRIDADHRRRQAESLLSKLGIAKSQVLTLPSSSSVLLRLALLLPEGGPSLKEALQRLAKVGIECGEPYVPLHREVGERSSVLPITDGLWPRVVQLPLSPAPSDPKQIEVLRQLWPLSTRS